ncbi:unnamed protein product [Mesocestoides corti]|uniref:DUF3336 domain-containing protein n=1 Tax=Mesocestoides corti TaxID=53468 RepID=A0A0R3UJ96_MESCO|nr:unnamed protein product [Mesocestoides corti]
MRQENRYLEERSFTQLKRSLTMGVLPLAYLLIQLAKSDAAKLVDFGTENQRSRTGFIVAISLCGATHILLIGIWCVAYCRRKKLSLLTYKSKTTGKKQRKSERLAEENLLMTLKRLKRRQQSTGNMKKEITRSLRTHGAQFFIRHRDGGTFTARLDFLVDMAYFFRQMNHNEDSQIPHKGVSIYR